MRSGYATVTDWTHTKEIGSVYATVTDWTPISVVCNKEAIIIVKMELVD